MSEPSSCLCLSCGEITDAGAFCNSCGNALSVTADNLSKLITRRLAIDGFKSITELLQDSENLIPIAIALEDQLAQKYQSLLMSPVTSGGSKSIHTLNIVGIIHGDELTPSETNILASEAYDVIKDTEKKFRGFKILATFFRVYVIYKDGCSLETVRAHKLPWRKRKSFRPNIQLSIIPIDCKKKKVYGGSKFIEPDMHVALAVKQIGTISENSEKTSFYLSLARLVFKKPIRSFLEYTHSLALVGNPPILAHRIATNRLSSKDLFGIFGVSAFLSAIIASLFRIDLGGFKLGFPLIDGILDNMLIIVTYMFTGFIYHLPLKLAGGTATFRSTFIATGYAGAVALPLIILIVGVMIFLGVPAEEAWRNAPIGSAVITLPVFSALHRLSVNRVLVLLVFIWPLAIMAVLLAIIFLFGLLS